MSAIGEEQIKQRIYLLRREIVEYIWFQGFIWYVKKKQVSSSMSTDSLCHVRYSKRRNEARNI